MKSKTGALQLRPATVADVRAISSCVAAAYGPYIPRMGQAPAPMLEDYQAVVQTREVHVGENDGCIVAVLVLAQTNEGFLLDNIAVHPEHQGRGIGRQLLEFAESRALQAGFGSIYLYTNVAMTENLRLYARIGYAEFARRTEKGLSRVYMRKRLAASQP